MGWSCGELWQYGKWYWDDPNVAECRESEAKSVCRDIFGMKDQCGAEDHHTSISQSNSRVNLMEFNLFGESHGVSHVGFFLFILVVIVFSVFIIVLVRAIRRWAGRLRESPASASQAPDPSSTHGWPVMSAMRTGDRAQPVVIQLDPRELVTLFRSGGAPSLYSATPSRRLAETDVRVESSGEERGAAVAPTVTPRVGLTQAV